MNTITIFLFSSLILYSNSPPCGGSRPILHFSCLSYTVLSPMFQIFTHSFRMIFLFINNSISSFVVPVFPVHSLSLDTWYGIFITSLYLATVTHIRNLEHHQLLVRLIAWVLSNGLVLVVINVCCLVRHSLYCQAEYTCFKLLLYSLSLSSSRKSVFRYYHRLLSCYSVKQNVSFSSRS